VARNDHLLYLTIAIIIGVVGWPLLQSSNFFLGAVQLQNLFGIVTAPGQPLAIAHTPNDTLHFNGQNGIRFIVFPLNNTIQANYTGNQFNYVFSSVGLGKAVYQNTVGLSVTFRSLIGTGGITTTQNANDITLGLANIPWVEVNKTGSILNDIGSPTSPYSFNNQRLTSLGTPISATDAQVSNHLGLIGNLVTTVCSNNQILKYNSTDSTWHCSNASTGTLISINNDGTPTQTIAGTANHIKITDVGATHTIDTSFKINNSTCSSGKFSSFDNKTGNFVCSGGTGGVNTLNGFQGTVKIFPQVGNTTITNSSNTITVGLGPNPLLVNLQPQTVTKKVTMNQLFLGGNENASGNRITNLAFPVNGNDSARMNTLGNNNLSPFGNPTAGQVLTFGSNSTWIAKTLQISSNAQVEAPDVIIFINKTNSFFQANNATTGISLIQNSNATTVVQTAMSHLASTGGKIIFQSGTYPIHIQPTESNIVFEGQKTFQLGSVILESDSYGHPIFDIKGNNHLIKTFPIMGFNFEGNQNRVAGVVNDCIFASQTGGLIIENSYFQGCNKNGIYLQEVWDSRMNDVNMGFSGNWTAKSPQFPWGYAGIYLTDLTSTSNSDNLYISGSDFETQNGIDIIMHGLGLGGGLINQIKITDTKFEDHFLNTCKCDIPYHIYTTNATQLTFIGDQFSSANGTNVNLQSGTSRVAMIGGIFTNNNVNASYNMPNNNMIINATDVMISNTFFNFINSGGSQIKIGNLASNISIIGNVISGTGWNVGSQTFCQSCVKAIDPLSKVKTFIDSNIGMNLQNALFINFTDNTLSQGINHNGTLTILTNTTQSGLNVYYTGNQDFGGSGILRVGDANQNQTTGHIISTQADSFLGQICAVGEVGGKWDNCDAGIVVRANQAYTANSRANEMWLQVEPFGTNTPITVFRVDPSKNAGINTGQRFNLDEINNGVANPTPKNYLRYDPTVGTSIFSNLLSMITLNGTSNLQTIDMHSMNTTNLKLGNTMQANEQSILNIHELSWNDGENILGTDPAGSIEIGNSTASSTSPYIDFHWGAGRPQDYNLRLINNGNSTLTIFGNSSGTGKQLAQFSDVGHNFFSIPISNIKYGTNTNANNFKITSLGTPTLSTDAQVANHLGLLGNMVTSTCLDTNLLTYHLSNQTWWCTTNGMGTITGAKNTGKGTGSLGWYSGVSSNLIQLKNITAGTNISISGNTTDITINSATWQNNTGTNLGTANGLGLYISNSGSSLQFRSVTCGVGLLCSNNSTNTRINDTDAGSGLKSLNGNTNSSQTIAGTANNVTITDAGATHTANLGSNAVVTNGNPQKFVKVLDFGSANGKLTNDTFSTFGFSLRDKTDSFGVQLLNPTDNGHNYTLSYPSLNSNQTLLTTTGSGSSLTGIPTSIAGTANNVTVSSSTGSITLNLGSNVVTTNLNSQTIKKAIDVATNGTLPVLTTTASNNANTTIPLFFTRQANEDSANHLRATAQGQFIGMIGAVGYNGGTFENPITSAGLKFKATQTHTASANGITMYGTTIANGATSGFIGWRLDQSGNFGITCGKQFILNYLTSASADFAGTNYLTTPCSTNQLVAAVNGNNAFNFTTTNGIVNVNFTIQDSTDRTKQVRLSSILVSTAHKESQNFPPENGTIQIQFNTNETDGGNRTGITSQTPVMHGLGSMVNTLNQGKIQVQITSGWASPSTLSSGCRLTVQYGLTTSVTTPTAGGSLVGTKAFNIQYADSAVAGDQIPINLGGWISGLSKDSKYWIDMSEANVGASGTCAVNNPSISLTGY